MSERHWAVRLAVLVIGALLILPISGCAESSGVCPLQPFADLSDAADYADDDSLPFQFPLDDASTEATPAPSRFCKTGWGDYSDKHHAAEDYHRPPGTPVYAIADGEVSFSGRMGGYGWLVIVDHPQANLYSLYGHLSPSRWQVEPGPVDKGDLLGYLGDDDENGGSADNPLVPHLHLGIRAGQRSDYSGMGEWRWMAGWIKPCPTDAGWLRPSEVITGQQIPAGGFEAPYGVFLTVWWLELLFGLIYVVGGAGMFVFATKKGRPRLLFGAGVLLAVAGWAFRGKGSFLSPSVFVMAAVLLSTGAYRLFRRPA